MNIVVSRSTSLRPDSCVAYGIVLALGNQERWVPAKAILSHEALCRAVQFAFHLTPGTKFVILSPENAPVVSEIWDNFTEFCVERGCKYQVLLLEVMVAFHLPNTSQVIRKSFRLETSVKDIRSEAERVIEEQAVAAGWIGPAPPAAGDDSNAETQTPPPYEDPNDRQHGCPSSALGHAHAGVKLCIGNRLVLRDGNRLLDYARRGENGMWEEVFLRCELDRP